MKNHGAHKRDENRVLLVELTQEELQEKAMKIGDLTAEIRDLEEEKKNISGTLGGKVKEAKGEILELSKMLRMRQEERGVECGVYNNFDKGMVFTVRSDTGEVINEREMSDTERQQDLTDGIQEEEPTDDGKDPA